MKHTIKAMTDLLFTVAETTARMDRINRDLGELAHAGEEDFATFIQPMAGGIEGKLADALDLFFEEITGCESLATHFFYETGMVTDAEGIEYRLTNRAEFDNFVQKHMEEKYK